MTTAPKLTLGGLIRSRRMERRVTLRNCAAQAEISATYLSMIERNEHSTPPAEDALARIATVLELDPGELLALAGRIPEDVEEILKAGPVELATFLRTAQNLSPAQLKQLTEQAEALRKKKKP
ncbi:MAG: hypothetical protein GEEBNDBF_00642 [bacterium]|nr:hypothetical protein [bacterium]